MVNLLKGSTPPSSQVQGEFWKGWKHGTETSLGSGRTGICQGRDEQ